MSTPQRDIVNRMVSRTLALASGLAATVIAVGVAAWLAFGAGQPADRLDATRWSQLGAVGIIGLGLVLITLTPVAQLVAALIAFARMGERREALLAGVVLAILVASVGVAAVVGEIAR